MSRIKALSVVFLSGGIVFFCLYQLSQLDFQTVLLLRSLHEPVVSRLAYLGNRLGDGLTLVLLCLGLWGVGYLLKNKVWQRAGIDGILAHALAGVAVQILKHLIGRPRPRWTHQDAFEYGPSWQGGLDAFPSGHAAASFAVAAVLARYFPAWRGLWYGSALFVGMARVAGGSHFPTDVLGGAVLGFLIGYIWARALKDWQENAVQALPLPLPLLIGGCAIFSNIFSHPVSDGVAIGTFWGGLLLLVAGIALRWRMVWQGSGPGHRTLLANSVIALGLAATTQALWVVVVTLLVCVVWWLNDYPDRQAVKSSGWLREAWFTSVLVIGLVMLQGLHGLVP
ncbi:MAG: phosphatase PAP2 family protein [Nitrospira sp. SB0677_bin_15]|nr:phosphatase PAP2 family protein [Nitrospira sp. SB0667_bin_9]MYG41073.1 phosphatase PAP2 family protein [Nitrospira sp. SB0677_bin_15]MYH02376.1 phosphatase PAP2 family protein [Nitrospira sp. SB0675_bin_23]MYJ22693.1 phosphatase PAP2 family protein [Nitrospira sp. SB0673_bin_12]